MTKTAPRIEFFRGRPPAAPPLGGASIWPYQRSDLRQRGGWQPFPEPTVPVILHGPVNWAKIPAALLDTGADTTAIPYGWATLLGCDLERAQSLTASGNGVTAEHLKPVERLRLEIGGHVIDLNPMFGPWETMFLGRDVFDHFRVIFDQRAGQVVLDPYGAA